MLSIVVEQLRGVTRLLRTTMLILPVTVASQAHAENTGFAYDALGRLTATSVSSGPSSGIGTSAAYDPAGNRTGFQVGGAASNAQRSSTLVVVVPLGGMKVISLPGSGDPF